MILIDFIITNEDEELRMLTLVAYKIIGFTKDSETTCILFFGSGEKVKVWHSEAELRLKLNPPKKKREYKRPEYLANNNPSPSSEFNQNYKKSHYTPRRNFKNYQKQDHNK
ncbi:MAG TPA: hypothetical protein VNU45_00330 [Rummeliibacillus sp.]|nr:hypothetical protein [Rummeliibacillus sp.]